MNWKYFARNVPQKLALFTVIHVAGPTMYINGSLPGTKQKTTLHRHKKNYLELTKAFEAKSNESVCSCVKRILKDSISDNSQRPLYQSLTFDKIQFVEGDEYFERKFSNEFRYLVRKIVNEPREGFASVKSDKPLVVEISEKAIPVTFSEENNCYRLKIDPFYLWHWQTSTWRDEKNPTTEVGQALFEMIRQAKVKSDLNIVNSGSTFPLIFPIYLLPTACSTETPSKKFEDFCWEQMKAILQKNIPEPDRGVMQKELLRFKESNDPSLTLNQSCSELLEKNRKTLTVLDFIWNYLSLRKVRLLKERENKNRQKFTAQK